MGQAVSCPAVVPVPPEPLRPNIIGTWAYDTVGTRMVRILCVVIATFAADQESLAKEVGAFGRESMELIQSDLEALLESLTSNGFLTRLTGEADDVPSWNAVLDAACVDGVLPRWHDGDWLYVECFMYRKLYDILDSSGVIRDYDYFHPAKKESFEQSVAVARDLAASLLETVSGVAKLSKSQLRVSFMEFLLISLWGNKCDLTMGGMSMKTSPLAQLSELAKYLLSDRHKDIFAYLHKLQQSGKVTRIDFICDNAGFELFSDLCLADFLSASGLAQRITFHVKAFPWFVSDTTRCDVSWLLERLKGDAESGPLQELAARWRKQLATGHWEMAESPFWQSPFPFRMMRQECPPLYWRLQGADLLLSKGDLNYRKLIGNRPWPVNTPLCRAAEGFSPAPLAALRVLKADCVAGIDIKRAKQAAELDPKWMTSGSFAVIQFCRHATVLDKI
ncbi:Protein-glutamate O-methyltransferase [Amphibalanus amphitrite]|uniref:Sugar phosphate phosphatase n=1 Tax=Amphibalanus amphitrite TaxID=1232801 RepID=A0A6A4VZH4_AMPAM|nr:Protein-glutamate O-methyltransferase [Amphibalanus amphitrite]